MSTKNKKQLKNKIDSLLNQIIDSLVRDLEPILASITLVGSYTLDKISLQRPNVNLLIFTKPEITAQDYLKLGDIFYKHSKKYLDIFSIKIDSLPFRTGFPLGDKKLQLIFTPNILAINRKQETGR